MKQALINKIESTKEVLRERFGITKIAVFGSYARGEEREDSDIDIVILEMKQKNGLTIAKAKKYLSEELHMNVDLGLFDSLRLFVKKRIEKELVYV